MTSANIRRNWKSNPSWPHTRVVPQPPQPLTWPKPKTAPKPANQFAGKVGTLKLKPNRKGELNGMSILVCTHTLTHLESKPESRRGGNCLPFLTKTWGNYEIHTGRQFSSTSNSLAAAPNKATVKIVNKLRYSSCRNKCAKYLIRSASWLQSCLSRDRIVIEWEGYKNIKLL